MAHLNIERISLSCKDRAKEEQKKVYRRKTILVLIHHYLREYGYIQASDALETEVSFDLKEYSVCDNIHLESVLQDYESYYFLKYQKLPQIMKKVPEDMGRKNISNKSKSYRLPRVLKFSDSAVKNKSTNDRESFYENVWKSAQETAIQSNGNIRSFEEHILEPLGSFENYSNDWKAMAELILQDMQTISRHVQWDDIIGHDRAKELLKEAVVYPIKYQELYCSAVSPWRSMLLYGPSGTGKTLLASAAASESGAVYFKICISTLISKWRGETEKLIKVLFDLAKHYSPSIVFIDEIDALLSHRGEDHEASRRMKTELFLQLDSLFSSDKLVFVLSATNIPWQLDYAILRRLEKRILISYPDEDCRVHLFKKFLPKSLKISDFFQIQMDLDYQKLSKVTNNYSASDIETVCKEAKMSYMRQVIKLMQYKPSGEKSMPSTAIQPLDTSDILQTINRIKPTASELFTKYEEWHQKHGSE